MAGCGTKPTQETTPPPALPKVGIVDMNTAVKAHPKYKDLMVFQEQAAALAAQLDAEQGAKKQQAQQVQTIPNLVDPFQQDMTQMQKALEEESNRKLTAKQHEIEGKISSKEESINRTLSDEMKAYSDQIEKEYQPQIFNLQLKLKVVQLSKEDATKIQTELDKLGAQQSQALALKQDQLKARMKELMGPEIASSEQEVAAYRKKLEDELAAQMAGKQAEFLKRDNEQHTQTPGIAPVDSELPQQLTTKQQEIEALQGFIVDDITNKVATVAVKGGFETIVTNVIVNVNAVDITTQVITECNK